MIISIQNSIQFTKQYLNALIGVEVVYFGTVLMGMLIAFFYPNLQGYYTDATEKELQSYYIGRIVLNAYDSGEFWKASTLTFLINFFVGTYVHIIIPSLIIPFAGLALAFYRALLWGILFAPIKPNTLRDGWPHLITLIMEGEGYILAALIVYLHGKQAKMIVRQGYKAWFRKGYEYNCQIYPLIVLILLIAALYEAYEVIYLLSPDAKKFGH